MAGLSRPVLAVGIVTLVIGASVVGAGAALLDPWSANPNQANHLAAADGGSNGKTVTVSASGEAEAEPDKAVVRVSVEATADDPTVARRRVADNASSMRQALIGLGIGLDDGDVRTTGFDIYEDRVRPPEPSGEPATTYRARHAFAVEVSDTGRVGQVIDTAVENGATSVHGVEFTLSEETRGELRREAIDEAMSDAGEQADAIAAAGGLTITGVRSARTGAISGPRPVRILASADGGSGGGTSLESGSVAVTATVTVVYNASG